MANSVLAKMAVEISANTAGFNKSLKSAETSLTRFQNTIGTAAKTLIAGFGAMQIASFTFEISKLAGEAEGVRAAFDKLPNSIQLMNDLKDATSGTVSELDLMKRAVMASNFGISLEALPKLLEFASVRAKQTGQSVDYLVDSIVTGIGRKSKLILDNLGISAVQLTEALGGASTAAASIEDVANAVGAIAEKEMEKMGSMSENASTKIERLAANWVNLKVAIGDAANGTGILGTAINALNGDMVRLTETINMGFKDSLVSAFPFLEDILGRVKTQTEKATEVQKRHAIAVTAVDKAFASGNAEKYISYLKDNEYFAEIMVEYNKRIAETEKAKAAEIENIANLTEKLNLLNTDQLTLTGSQLIATNKEIKSIEEKIKKLRELGIEQSKQKKVNEFDSDEARQGRIARLDRSFITPEVKNKLGIDPKINTDAITSMTSAQDALTESIKKQKDAQVENNLQLQLSYESWLNFGQAASNVIAGIISADRDLLASVKKTAASIIQQNAVVIASWLAAKFAKDSATKTPVFAIAALTVGLGVVAGLLGKDWRKRGMSANSFSGGGQGSFVTVSMRQRGTDLVGVGIEENRMRARTRG